MPDESLLSDEFLRELINVGEVDILVGVPTHNDARTVGQVVQSVRAGLLKCFPRARTAILNADGGSQDDTQNLVRAASISDLGGGSGPHALRTLHSISTQYRGSPANGTALRTMLAAADLLRAKACAVVSPQSTRMDPEWIGRLVKPVLDDGADLVLPVYQRHRFDGLLIRNLVYPLVRTIYGCDVREPYPADYAFSGSLGNHFMDQDIWSLEQGRHGTELWLTLVAITNRYKIQQSFLGTRERLETSPSDVVAAMRETAGILFLSMDSQPEAWKDGRDSLPAPCNGCQAAAGLEPGVVNRPRLHQMFTLGISQLEPVFASILAVPTHAELKRLAEVPETQFAMPESLWARTVYEFAAAYHRAVIGRDHILQALVPLFRGRALTFVAENDGASESALDANVEKICHVFEAEKPYLIQLWDGGK